MKEKIGTFAFQIVAYIVILIMFGAIARNMHDLFMFGYNLGY